MKFIYNIEGMTKEEALAYQRKLCNYREKLFAKAQKATEAAIHVGYMLEDLQDTYGIDEEEEDE